MALTNVTSFEIGVIVRLRNAAKAADKQLFVACRQEVKDLLEKNVFTNFDCVHFYAYEKQVDEFKTILNNLNLGIDLQ